MLMVNAEAARQTPAPVYSSLETALKANTTPNIEDAFGQARRAARFIDETESPVFEESASGRQLNVPKDQITRTFLITVSLHHLAGLANRLSSLKNLGLFRDGQYPFSISVSDLETVAQFCDGPDVFLHYVERRLAIQRDHVDILADELDLFGAYLQTRLQPARLWDRDGVSPTTILLTGYSQKFDDWASFQRGDRKDPPEISLEVPEETKQILAAIAEGFANLKTATFTPGLFRTLKFTQGDTVISIVAVKGDVHDPLPMRTHLRAMLEKYRYKVQKSIAFGVDALDSTVPFECAVWLDEPWMYDAELEMILNDEPPFVAAPGTTLPGRNDSCMCGSGKKFKNCCLPMFESGRRKLPKTRM